MRVSRRRKFILLLMIALVVGAVACGPKRKGSRGGGPADKGTPGPSEVGGVDVGNMTVSEVPKSQVVINHTWTSNSKDENLILSKKSGSTIRGKKIRIEGVTDATTSDLLRHYGQKYPDRSYQAYNINGFQGVRANGLKESRQPSSKIDVNLPYISHIILVSDLKETIELDTKFLSIEDEKEGESFISTVRIRYKGEALQGQPVKNIKISSRSRHGVDNSFYNFKSDCYPYSKGSPGDCNHGVYVTFGNGGGKNFQVGTAGSDTGRIIELGPESEVNFDKVKIKGLYLESPKSKVPLSEIYSKFSPNAPMQSRDRIELKEGYVYLLRTISWPGEDLLVKFKVESLTSSETLELKYQKLAEIPKKVLKSYVDVINEATKKYEMVNDRGEVTLFSRNNWGDYTSATFNFTYGTRDNVYIVRNSWDLLFEGRDDDLKEFRVPTTWHGVGAVVDLGAVELDNVEKEDFPNMNEALNFDRALIVVGHTYAVVNFENEGHFVYAAVKVISLDSENRFVALKWRRLAIEKSSEIQQWREVDVDPNKIEEITLEINGSEQQKSRFLPGQNIRADQSNVYSNNLTLDPWNGHTFSVDDRHFPKVTGLIYLPNTNLASINAADAKNYEDQYERDVEVRKGVYLAQIMGLWEKDILAFEVIEILPGISVKIKYRRLFVGQLKAGQWTH